MPSRMKQAVSRLRTRLRDSSGLTATVIDGNQCVIALQIVIVQLDLIRAVRAESEFQLEDDDVAFLIGTDVMPQSPDVGWRIATQQDETLEILEYRVTERPELEACWRWHDREEQSRVVFAKEWKRS